MVARVGRRGGKSSTLCRLAVVEALYGHHDIPAGDRGIVAIVSARRVDALARLRTIRAILDAIGAPYRASGDSVHLETRPVTFQVYTASIAGVSGFTSVFVLLDEVAKWRDTSTGANPAQIVIDSIIPTTATMPNARVVLISSPMGLSDAHAVAFARGNTDGQIVVQAPTWVANPTLSEDKCRALARGDVVSFLREYAAIPQAETEDSLYDGAALSRCLRPSAEDVPPDARHRYVVCLDPSTRGSSWTLVVATLSDNSVRKVCLVRQWSCARNNPTRPSEVFAEIKRTIKPYNQTNIFADQSEKFALNEIANRHGLTLLSEPQWSTAQRASAYEGLRTLINDGLVELPNDTLVVSDILGVRKNVAPSGVSYELTPNGERCSDYATAIAMACMLARVPPAPVERVLSVSEKAQKERLIFLEDRRKKRELAERRSRFDVRHRVPDLVQKKQLSFLGLKHMG
jgi:hypothetical protein